ncbi:alpha/beta hydrolase [Mycobacterium sp.]|uniref:alpha/beta fold hydrolase n=1 Tax=Mycobacterium sp. TaxID=1785 RepID=UPI0031E0DC0C
MFYARRTAAPPPEQSSLTIGTLPRQHVALSCGTVSYLRHGRGPSLLLVHGIPTSARLWEPLLGALGEHFDCIVPDVLGLGRSRPAPGADLASPGQADMLAELLDSLGIDETLLVLHDQGGAHGQQLLVRHGSRVRAVVFCDVVCFDNWLVPVIDVLSQLTRHPGVVRALGRRRVLQLPMRTVYPLPQTVVRGPLPRALVDDWFHPLDTGDGLDDWCRYVRSQDPRWTIEAVPTLQAWTKPAHVIWAASDRFLPPSWAVRLAHTIPGADDRPTLLADAGHFFQPEVPVTASAALLDFLLRFV